MKRAFSIIEVLFAVAFLIMVGLALMSLNAAALRLINNAELQTVANSLNEESMAVIAITKKTDSNTFPQLISSLNCGVNCYVDCPADSLQQSCSLSAVKAPVQLGRNKLQFVRSVTIAQVGSTNSYNVLATVSWGNGVSKQSVLSEVIE